MVPLYLKNFLKNCDHVFAPTNSMEEYLKNTCNVNPEEISVLPTGLSDNSFFSNTDRIKAIREKYLPNGGNLFCSVSRLSHEKNINYLLSMLQLYKKKTRSDFCMLFIGEGPNRQEYEKRCEELGLKENVVFTGCVPNNQLTDYYHASDLFLFASKTETQGIVILETMAAGTPVIALQATGVSDIVNDGVNGYNVMESMDEFADKIRTVLTNDTLYKTLSKGAEKTAVSYKETSIAKEAATGYYQAMEHIVIKKQVLPDKMYAIMKTAN